MASTSNVGAFHELAPSASFSASSLLQKPQYDVFINHRGPDVKEKLASRLYNIFNEMKLTAFLDSQELEYGDFLPTTLEAAMRSASLHIAIFSEKYAKSPWCLAELSFMLKTGAKIIPVFYYVEPTDLKYVAQGKGIYVDAFVEYEKKRRYSPERLQEWKMALNNVSFYIGQIIKNDDDEMRLLKNIVNIVLKEINNVPLVVANHPVGLEEILQDFERNTFQSVQEGGVRIVGIWGMGGSGKTTLAKKLYNERSLSMERSSFIFDVRDSAAKNMLHNKQIELLKCLGVKKEDRKFENIEQGKAILTKHLRSVRVLIVLDDVDHVDQLDALLPVKDNLGGGSLIIVTTRENEVLRSKGILSVYKMRALDPFYAEQLFCWHAFSQSIPLNGFENLVKKFLDACNGLPLSLKVFGGQLYGEFRKEYWESLLQKILRILPNDIKEKLKVGYDALDYEEKEMFLDTACFFIGEDNSLAIEVWNGSGWSGLYGWEKLFNKCLVELDEYNCIKMHDHLRDLGKEIANQHSPYRLGLAQQIINKTTGIRGIMTVPSSMIIWKSREPVKSYQMMDPFCEISSDEELMANTIGRDWSLAPSFLGPNIFVIRGDYFNKVICEV
ncbi:TMV resistance protein N [Cryptomeria japonica]|uniref:TMV resistance protein N n=1 Tax=Cryptomeria japonica TaxID=3369 RepID=UPI0027DA39BF|nr:TMV resistance protein N [Cryptomeria japonica]